jgi:anti-sigma factor RsiW
MAESVPSRVTCEQATALLLDYVTDTLDPATTLVLERHLSRCNDCVAFLQTYKETIRAWSTRDEPCQEICAVFSQPSIAASFRAS